MQFFFIRAADDVSSVARFGVELFTRCKNFSGVDKVTTSVIKDAARVLITPLSNLEEWCFLNCKRCLFFIRKICF
jgi:hypothetical protein